MIYFDDQWYIGHSIVDLYSNKIVFIPFVYEEGDENDEKHWKYLLKKRSSISFCCCFNILSSSSFSLTN
jgi:hypothetical protein